ncbi:MAG: hypothetical protein HYS12_06175 [Planctomycetes bacterium]|nr:hypothetical protein [Planctomycetota bacterium]
MTWFNWFRRQPTHRRQPRRFKPVLEALEDRALLSVYTVTNTGNSGLGTLRQAILDANNHAGMDEIHFNISGSGPHTIQLSSALGSITDPVIIDGYTQPGARENTLSTGSDAVLQIELTTNAAVPNGLILAGTDSVVKGLAINGFQNSGIFSTGARNQIRGNFIGTNLAGDAARGNGVAGVYIINTSSNIVGGTDPKDRNVISGNGTDGVIIGHDVATSNTPPAQSNQVLNNYIGTNAQGTAALGNVFAGVDVINAVDSTVGGTTASARNVISGNFVGVQIYGASQGTLVEGNYIGLDASGGITAPPPSLGNAGAGVIIRSFASDNTVGGLATGARNVISGNGDGVLIQEGAQTNIVEGNSIGTDASGTQARGNVGSGVKLLDVRNNTVGGTDSGAGNVISGNGQEGVRVAGNGATGNRIQHNSLFANGGLGINLVGGIEDPNLVTANDPMDADTGPNNL